MAGRNTIPWQGGILFLGGEEYYCGAGRNTIASTLEHLELFWQDTGSKRMVKHGELRPIQGHHSIDIVIPGRDTVDDWQRKRAI